MNLTKVFEFDNKTFNIDIKIDDQNKEWFWAADIAKACNLEHNYRKHLIQLDDDEKKVCKKYTPSGDQSGNRISESGVYFLISKGRNEQCKFFNKWVRKEVLPGLRQNGHYTIPYNNCNQNYKTEGEILAIEINNTEKCINIFDKLGTLDDLKKLELSDRLSNKLGLNTLSENVDPIYRSLTMYIDDGELNNNNIIASKASKYIKQGTGKIAKLIKEQYFSINNIYPKKQKQNVGNRIVPVCIYNNQDYNNWIHQFLIDNLPENVFQNNNKKNHLA